jgi:hypothetical protein
MTGATFVHVEMRKRPADCQLSHLNFPMLYLENNVIILSIKNFFLEEFVNEN